MAVKELDCLCEVCPVPLLKAMNELKKMKPGDILILHSDHSCVGISVQEWAQKNKYPVQVVEVEDGEWEVYIEKPKEE
ncbi:sulfurtransferase TusA family protein [Tepidibacter thalassicus]|uniref:TusA-related sulfurtransferase n=1 Tax=Tepidibacter thalassicus DSM 15285 TaxID=1123350 RepID=A0A1M5PNL3_9FIRM|nr:sulfurtransferase TusA family protein [Tepidibacter thalassicus]SHH02813.1 TusA-related sulfurtransferase [Tepidibacter thalassicus DSM 15285]